MCPFFKIYKINYFNSKILHNFFSNFITITRLSSPNTHQIIQIHNNNTHPEITPTKKHNQVEPNLATGQKPTQERHRYPPKRKTQLRGNQRSKR